MTKKPHSDHRTNQWVAYQHPFQLQQCKNTLHQHKRAQQSTILKNRDSQQKTKQTTKHMYEERADVKVGMHGSTVATGSIRKRKLIHAWLRTRVRSMHECSFVVHGLPSPTLAFEFLNALLMLKYASKQFTLWQHCHIAVGFSDVFTPPLRLQFKAIRSRRFDAHPGNVDDTLNAQWIF